MKYAILSDIHGNQYALKEVLSEVKKLGIRNLLLLGDYVGYYYGIVSVLEQLREFNVIAIRGNHEDLLLKAIEDNDTLTALKSKYGSSHSRCIESLPKHEIEYLTQLPRTCELNLGDLTLLLCHGTPWSTDEYMYPDEDQIKLSRYDDYEYDFIFFGHTHYRAVFERDGKKVVNPGSVGQSREKGGVAFWGILDSKEKLFEQKATLYDVKALEQEINEIDPELPYNLNVLRR